MKILYLIIVLVLSILSYAASIMFGILYSLPGDPTYDALYRFLIPVFFVVGTIFVLVAKRIIKPKVQS